MGRSSELYAAQQERDEAGREASADLLNALKDLYDLCSFHSSPNAFSNGVTDSTGAIDEGDVRASRILESARAAIAAAERS